MGIFSFFSRQPTREECLELARRGETAFLLKHKKFTDDKEVMLEVVKSGKLTVWMASDRLRNDLDIARATLEAHPDSIFHLGPVPRADKAFMTAAVSKDGLLLRHASDGLKDDMELALLAIGNNPQAFACASPRIQDELDPDTGDEDEDDEADEKRS